MQGPFQCRRRRGVLGFSPNSQYYNPALTTDNSGSLDLFLQQAITSSNYDNIAQANLAAIQTTVDSITRMENEIYANFTTERIGDDLSQYWYNNMTVYIDQYVGKVNNINAGVQ